jgi:RNA polymerase sigma factor (sigma-70 family)
LNEFSSSLPLNAPPTTPVVSRKGSADSGALAALTARMARQDEAAFVEFLDLYRDRLFRYTIVLVRGDEESAKEAMQQTMMRVVRHIRRFEDEAVFWSWLTRLTRSVVTDEARKRNRYRNFLARFFGHRKPEAHVSEPASDDPTLLARLESLLPTLPPDEADLIRRKYFLGETVREISAQLDTTEKAIESRLVRIRRRLRETILKEAKNE